MLGITIGRYAVIVGRTVVTRDVREETVFAGVPGRVPRYLREKSKLN
jgi:acetyltransferase-like isoleucine patch superfamily enzyme